MWKNTVMPYITSRNTQLTYRNILHLLVTTSVKYSCSWQTQRRSTAFPTTMNYLSRIQIFSKYSWWNLGQVSSSVKAKLGKNTESSLLRPSTLNSSRTIYQSLSKLQTLYLIELKNLVAKVSISSKNSKQLLENLLASSSLARPLEQGRFSTINLQLNFMQILCSQFLKSVYHLCFNWLVLGHLSWGWLREEGGTMSSDTQPLPLQMKFWKKKRKNSIQKDQTLLPKAKIWSIFSCSKERISQTTATQTKKCYMNSSLSSLLVWILQVICLLWLHIIYSRTQNVWRRLWLKSINISNLTMT